MIGNRALRLAPVFICVVACAALAGCGKSQAQSGPPKPEPPEIDVSLPVTATVTDYEYFPGRLAAKKAVEIRARVTGYLEAVHFQEGADVEEGTVLFEIDPEPYEAELLRAEGNLKQSRSRLKRLDDEYERAKGLEAKGALSREELARVTADRTEAQGLVQVNEAAVKLARLNVGFTKVKAPFSGRISSRTIDPGNLVKADDTALTTIVSLDPIYATFDLDERSLLRLKKLIRDGKIKWSIRENEGLSVHLGLADEEGFPHQDGRINFADNRVDADTGTWRLRGEFPNPPLNPSREPSRAPEHALAPGMFVRIRLPMGTAYQAVLVAEAALGTDQGQKYLYVIGPDDVAQRRNIKVGQLHDGLRVISEGLETGERVVVNGLQRVRNGSPVKPAPVPMPGVAAP